MLERRYLLLYQYFIYRQGKAAGQAQRKPSRKSAQHLWDVLPCTEYRVLENVPRYRRTKAHEYASNQPGMVQGKSHTASAYHIYPVLGFHGVKDGGRQAWGVVGVLIQHQ